MEMNRQINYDNDGRMNSRTNKKFGENFDNGIGNFNPNFFNGNEAAATAAANMTLSIGKQVLVNNKLIDYFSLNFLKPYFEIDNIYVLKKIKYILLPFLYKVNLKFHYMKNL